MNNRRFFFIFLLLIITGTSAFLFAKSRLEKQTRYEIVASRGEIMASSHNPIQGRIVLTQVRPSVIHYPARGKAASLTIRSWLADWSEFPSKASITFQNNEEDTHLEFELSKPYYDRARQLLTFDIQGKIVLTPYSTIRDVQLFVHE